MNTVTISGTLVRRGDDIENRRLPKVFLEVYNPEVRDVLVAVVYGRLRAQALPEGLHEGAMVEISGRLANVHWRTPGAGRMVREIGVEVQRVGLVGQEAVDLRPAAPRRVSVRATPAQVAEVRRLAEQMGLDDHDLREKYLDGREPADIPRNEAVEILQRMARDAHAAAGQVRPGAQLDQMTRGPAGDGDEQVEAWVRQLLDTPVAEIASAVAALPDSEEVRRPVLEEALKREQRPRGRSILERLLKEVVPAEPQAVE